MVRFHVRMLAGWAQASNNGIFEGKIIFFCKKEDAKGLLPEVQFGYTPHLLLCAALQKHPFTLHPLLPGKCMEFHDVDEYMTGKRENTGR